MVQSALFWLVLAVAVAVNWALPPARRPLWLVALSSAYLLSLDTLGVLPLFGWIGLVWGLRGRIAATPALGRFLVLGLVVSLVLQLAYFKYLPPLLSLFSEGPARTVVVPLGISFITFRLIHYVIETRRGALADHGVWDYLSWATLFTIWTAGPIERFDHFLAQRRDTPTRAMFAEGLTRIMLGLIKKFVFGLQLVPLLFGDVSTPAGFLAALPHLSTPEAWRYLILSFFLFYLDFSAYSDIAIGASRLLGLGIMENFNWPILASNPAVYWKRWHMTLSGWCQSYVYMPVIGLTRNPYLAVFASFICIGLWHAGSWTWIAWGLYHAVAVAGWQTWARLRRRHDWQWAEQEWLRYPAVIGVILYTSVPQGFTLIQGLGVPYDGLRILAKLVFITLPA